MLSYCSMKITINIESFIIHINPYIQYIVEKKRTESVHRSYEKSRTSKRLEKSVSMLVYSWKHTLHTSTPQAICLGARLKK